MGVAVITGASSGIGTVYADRLGRNRHQDTIDSTSRGVLVESSV